MKNYILHIDVNSAFLSWSAIKRLQEGDEIDLRTVPSIIGGDQSKRHGIVLAKSSPAKKYGIVTGEPVTDALRKCPDLLIAPPERFFYSECSRKLMTLLSDFSDSITQFSVDECFLDYRSIPGDGGDVVKGADIIRETVYDQLGFTVNIGISTNRLLAKMASDFEKPNRTHTLFPEEIQRKMWPLPIRDLFMVGKSSAARLELLGIKTIGDLARTDPELIKAHLKSHGLVIWEYANGIERSKLGERTKDDSGNKGIGNSTTLSSDIRDEEAARKVLMQLAESVSGRLRKASSKAGMVSVEIKYNTFESVSHQMQLAAPTQSTNSIYQAACQLFSELWNGTPIRLLGIRSSKLSDASSRQLTLFDYQENEKQEKLDRALDDIRTRFGKDAVKRGSFMTENKKETPYD